MFFLPLWQNSRGGIALAWRPQFSGLGIPWDWTRRRFSPSAFLWHSLPVAGQESKKELGKGIRKSPEVEFQLGLPEKQEIPAWMGIQNP